MEEWRDVKGFEGLYQVSNLGRVRSLNYLHTGKERVLKQCKNNHGYQQVTLYKDGKVKKGKVHRLVAEAFIPNPDGLPCVNHIDECKTNNIVTNLEWCTVKYNTNYGTGIERMAKVQRNHPNRSTPVYQYTLDGSLVRSYLSTHEAARQTGYSRGNICACCYGKRKKAYGYIWSYAFLSVKGKLF